MANAILKELLAICCISAHSPMTETRSISIRVLSVSKTVIDFFYKQCSILEPRVANANTGARSKWHSREQWPRTDPIHRLADRPII